jgi:hypothetical protein
MKFRAWFPSVIAIVSVVVLIDANAQTLEELLSQRRIHYSVSSKAQGAPFDLVATEVRREPWRSYLSVPGFHQRTAAGTRWLMCVYTDLAIKRQFSHWNVVYPAEDSDVVVVGFSASDATPLDQVLGAKNYVPERTLSDKPVPVEKFRALCGMSR